MKSEEEAQKTMDKMLNARGSILGGAVPQAPEGDAAGTEDEDDPFGQSFAKKIEARRQQHRREVRIAHFITEKIATFVDDRNEGQFLREIAEEAQDLRSTSFGSKLLGSIGFVYSNCAEQFFAAELGISGAASSV